MPDNVGPPPIPVVAAAWTGKAQVTFAWTYHRPSAGDSFTVGLTGSGATNTTRATTWVLDNVTPGSRPCLDVWVVRSTLRTSAVPGSACAP